MSSLTKQSRFFIGIAMGTLVALAGSGCTNTPNASNGTPDSGPTGHAVDAAVSDGHLADSARAVPQATTYVAIVANLDARDLPIADPQNPGAQLPDFPMIVTVYDSLGASHVLTIDFYRMVAGEVPGDSEWTWTASANNSEITEAGGSAPVQTIGQSVIAGGFLDFTTDGALDVSAANQLSDVTFNAAAQQSIDFADHFGDAITPPPPSTLAGTGLQGITQFASGSTVYSVTVDGGFGDSPNVITADGHLAIDAPVATSTVDSGI